MTNITFADIIVFSWAVIIWFFKGSVFMFCYGCKATMTQSFNAKLLIQMTVEVRRLGTKFLPTHLFLGIYICLSAVIPW